MMRLRSLTLERFGRFSGRSIDFGPKPASGPDFHIIHGPNEAGKTTTMEGWLRLLYGFEHREPYAFLHQRKNLEVSGTLEIDGRAWNLRRLPLRNGALQDRNGAAVPETVLSAALAGLGQDDYRKLLCLDDATIERGGEEIVASEGDIGRLLFSAAAGLSDLSKALDGVEAQAAALYRKGASKTRFAELRKELDAAAARIKEIDVTAADWKQRRQRLETAQAEEAETRRALTDLRERAARLAAMEAALPRLEEVAALDAALAGCGRWPDRLDLDPETLVRMVERRAALTAERDQRAREAERLATERDKIGRDPRGLDLPSALAPLRALRSRFETAFHDLPRREEALGHILADMARAAADLGAPEGADPLTLVLPEARLSALDAARARLLDARRDARAERDEVASLAEQLSRAAGALARQAEEAPADDPIPALLERHDAAALSEARALAERELREARARLREALGALSLGRASFEAAPRLPLPPEEAEALAETLRGLEQEGEALAARLSEARSRREAAQARIAALQGGAGLVPDAEAQAAQAARDRLWSAHRAALSEPTAEAFEAAMRALDAIAARRLERADALADLRAQELDLADRRAAEREASEALDRLARRREAALAPLAAAAQEVGLDPAPAPGVFARWLRLAEAARAAEAALDAAEAEHGPTLARAERLRAALAATLDGAGDSAGTVAGDGADAETDLRPLLARAQKRAEALREARAERDAARQRVRELEEALAGRETRKAAAEAERDAAETAWAQALTDLGLPRPARDAPAAPLDALRRLRELDVGRRDTQRRVAAMAEDRDQFAQAVAALATAHGLAPDAPPLEAFDALDAAGRAAEQAETRRAELSDRLETAAQARDEARRGLELIAAQAADLGALFDPSIPTGTLEELRAAVARAGQIIAERARRAELEREVTAGLGVPDIPAAHALLEGRDAPALAAAKAEAEAELDRARARLDAGIEARTEADAALRAVAGDAEVAALTERRRTLLAELQEVAQEHLELTLGRRLAEGALRRYRDVHRSAMMEAAERAFAELTAGAYPRLRAQPDGGGETLVALDAAGAAKRAADMSKGARFQLYLALRAAAYEQIAASGTILPFFCDDVFETFDETRTTAACRLMDRIGRTGQAIYLTHHRHVVEIAQATCENVRIHAL